MNFVRFCLLTDDKIMKQKSAIRIRMFAIVHHKSRFLLRDLDLHFRFQMFKICEIRSFSYVAGLLKLCKILQYIFNHLRLKGVSHIFSFVTLIYIFDFQYLQYVKFVHFRIFPEVKIMKKIAIRLNIQTFAIARSLSLIFLLRDLDRDLALHFRFQMFKIC